MRSHLLVSGELDLPLEVLTDTGAVLGIRGSGKTNTAVVLTEELLKLGQQVVIIDPTDAWWGLRSSKDGKKAAYPVVVFGGRHKDVDLAAGDGNAIADFVVDERMPAILSLRHLESQADQRKFITDFARRLFFRKGEENKDTPMLLIIDEAHLCVPQRVGAAEAPMVGAIQKIVRQGRLSGLGMLLIDQRAASVNKDVLTQLEMMICHRTSAPLDQDTLEDWIERQDSGDHRAEFMASLAKLPKGNAWFWSPNRDLFKRVQVRERETFDSSKTPVPGERAIAPTKLADVDMESLRTRFAASLETARANDPEELKRENVELRKQLKQAESHVVTTELEVEVPTVPVHVLDVMALAQRSINAAIMALDDAVRACNDVAGVPASKRINGISSRDAVAQQTSGTINGAPSGRSDAVSSAPPSQLTSRRAEAPKSAAPLRGIGHGDGTPLAGGERKILTALAQHGTRTKQQIAILTGYAVNGGGFANYLGALRSKGLAVGASDGLSITPAGVSALGRFEPLPTGPALIEHWKQNAGGACARRIIEELVSVHPRALSKEALAHRTGYEAKGGGFANALGRLRTLNVIKGSKEIRASEELFS